MNELIFTAVTAENRAVFHKLMQMYAKELDEHQHRSTPSDVLEKWTDSIIDKQYTTDRYLKLCYTAAEVIGFLYGRID